jgi:integrase
MAIAASGQGGAMIRVDPRSRAGHRDAGRKLCAIRWSDIDFAQQDLLIERAYSIRGGQKVIKATKTHQRRRLALDPAAVGLRAEYRELCGKRAAQAGGMLAADSYVFSSDGFGEQPWPPDTLTHWFQRVRAAAGVDCTLRSLRHYKRHSDARGRD